jgi:hypothetical protein
MKDTENKELAEIPPISASSRWNILFMKRTNRMAIAIFVGGILFKIIQHAFFK